MDRSMQDTRTPHIPSPTCHLVQDDPFENPAGKGICIIDAVPVQMEIYPFIPFTVPFWRSRES